MDETALISRKAGRIQSDGKRKVPDKRRGVLKLWMVGAVAHIGWHEDTAGAALELDVEVYDGEASFRHLSQFPGRIMLLEIAHSGENEQYFFWMQDSQKDDENFVVIVNELIGESEREVEDEVAETAALTDSEAQFDMAEVLRRVVAQTQQQQQMMELSAVFDPDKLLPVLMTFTEEEQQRLREHLPIPEAPLSDEILGAQFQQAVQQFSAALSRPGALHAIFVQLGLDPTRITTIDGVEAFLSGLQAAVDEEKRSR